MRKKIYIKVLTSQKVVFESEKVFLWNILKFIKTKNQTNFRN